MKKTNIFQLIWRELSSTRLIWRFESIFDWDSIVSEVKGFDTPYLAFWVYKNLQNESAICRKSFDTPYLAFWVYSTSSLSSIFFIVLVSTRLIWRFESIYWTGYNNAIILIGFDTPYLAFWVYNWFIN